jgi:hypothetical protein
MKKLVFASVVALAGIGLISAPALRAQESGQISLPPAQFNAYQNAMTQTNPQVKAADLETFLQTYPQSPVKKTVLETLMDTYYQGLKDQDKTLSAATRLLQLEPDNLKAILYSVLIKKGQCGNTSDAQTCDDAAALAQKGLTVPKPADIADTEWKTLTTAAYPIFHAAIGLDEAISKKDYKAAEAAYTAELMLYTDDQTKSAGLIDMLELAHVYAMPGPGQDLVKASWFYARVWDFAPAAYQAKIEPLLEYYYKKYHGGLDGLDKLKQDAAATTFPPATLVITPAKSPQEQIHDLIASTPDLTTLALADKETVLAMGSKDDADKVWAVMQGKPTPVPGTVISADANTIKVAVSQDAKDAKTADFIVAMKTPLKDDEIPAVGSDLGLSSNGQVELDGTYNSYTQVPATATTAASAQIELSDGVLIPVKKAPVRRRPPAVHRRPQ